MNPSDVSHRIYIRILVEFLVFHGEEEMENVYILAKPNLLRREQCLYLNVLDVVCVTNWLKHKRSFLSIFPAIDCPNLWTCLLTSAVLCFHMINVESNFKLR